jgi:MoaA/NifB/PqqE/SkfB family radical SAM enzyme
MAISVLKLSGRLLGNGLRYRYLKWTGKPGRPQALSLEITHHCVAKCLMCNIWKIPKEVPDLPLERWVSLLSMDLFSDLRELDLTGGEPFLRKDLPDLISNVCGLKAKNLKALKSLAVTTNGLLTDRVLNLTPSILSKLREVGLDLVMVCALDAVGPLHDQIRNYPDAWSRVRATLDGLKKIRGKFPNLIIGLKTTIVPLNVGELGKIVELAEAEGFFTIISPCIVTPGRYLNPDRAAELVFSPEAKEQMTGFFHSQRFRWAYHNQKLLQWVQQGVMDKPCTCGFNYLFVRYNGDVFLCPLITGSRVGNIEKTSLDDLWISAQAARFRKKIGGYPECLNCTEPGLERYALPFEGFSYSALLFTMGKEEFLKMHGHMGLDKFLN